MQFTASAGLLEKLERLRALMRSQVPDGDLGAVIEAAVAEKLERLEARRFAATARPRKDLTTTDTSTSSRRIPRLSAAACASATEADAGTSTPRGAGAGSGIISSTTTFTPSAWAETTAPTTSA